MKGKKALKKAAILAAAIVIFLALCVIGINLVADPFGVFGDRFLNWPQYNMGNSPGLAKMAFLNKNHENYDSFILGGPEASAYSADRLNGYWGAKVFNAAIDSADMAKIADTAKYILQNYQCKNMLLSLNFSAICASKPPENDTQITGFESLFAENAADFYTKYLFFNPKQGAKKLYYRLFKGDLPYGFAIFNPQNGSLGLQYSDVEGIGSLEEYSAKYASSAFSQTPETPENTELERYIEAVLFIKSMCRDYGVNLIIAASPVFSGESGQNTAQIAQSLSKIGDFYDFTASALCRDMRYFYDSSRFRSPVGDMVLAAIFGDSSIYYPADFSNFAGSQTGPGAFSDKAYTARVPILLYHHIDEGGEGGSAIDATLFKAHMEAIRAEGFEAVSFNQLFDYVYRGIDLPQNPVVITFDDGYSSNFDIAYPILQQLEMKATIFVIGVSVGKDTYKDTGSPITPHFSFYDAGEMAGSGLISIQSHTYDMHQWPPLEKGTFRTGVLPMEGESKSAYEKAYMADLSRSVAEIQAATLAPVNVLAYPYGHFTRQSEYLAAKMGFLSTLTVVEGPSLIIKGLPQSLFAMKRIAIDDISVEKLLTLLK